MPPGLEIFAEQNCLSCESAQGFLSLGISKASNATIFCGISARDPEMLVRARERIAAGGWTIWEMPPAHTATQARILRKVFGIAVGEPIRHSPDRLYIRYCWPNSALVRCFSSVTPIACSASEAIGFYGNTSVAMTRAIGRGRLVLLGSMLGPSLRAEDREARTMVARMLKVPSST